MTLAEIVAVTGLPGIYKVVSRRNDGLIGQSLETGQTSFIPARTHLFTTLDSITIYTTEDGVELKKVFSEMLAKKDSLPVPDAKVKEEDLKKYVKAIIPNYDKEKVYASDMKKLIKWYHLISAKGWMEEVTSDVPAESKEELKSEVKKEEVRKKAVSHDGGQKAQAKPAPVKKITTPRKAS